MKTETELLIELEKIRIRKIELSSKCRLKELILKRDIAMIYRNKKKKKNAEKKIIELKESEEKK